MDLYGFVFHIQQTIPRDLILNNIIKSNAEKETVKPSFFFGGHIYRLLQAWLLL